MADTAYKTIVLEGENLVTREALANAAITPGHLVELMSTGKLRVHANAAQNAMPMFAVEDDLQGNDITTAYSANNIAKYVIPRRGDVVYALLADGQNAAIGNFLESAGDGTLQVHTEDIAESAEAQTIYTMPIVAQAIEAVDMSDSSGGDPTTARIKVRIV